MKNYILTTKYVTFNRAHKSKTVDEGRMIKLRDYPDLTLIAVHDDIGWFVLDFRSGYSFTIYCFDTLQEAVDAVINCINGKGIDRVKEVILSQKQIN